MRFDKPLGAAGSKAGWASDVAAQMLRELDLPYVALNPGASFRGFHDSLVNHLGNADPAMLLCLHEEHAVAIAQGYFKATGRSMAVALHSNVGLMHASMAIFNAWCDRAAMVVVGATGPLDADLRRPWIDWIHTARDQAALVRPFIKWDDQPGSVPALVESFRRADRIARTAPCGPVYVCLDAALQEQPLSGPAPETASARYAAPLAAAPSTASIDAAVDLIGAAKRIALLIGRTTPDQAAWDARIRLAERLGAAVLTDLKMRTAFPTDHPQHGAPTANFLSPEGRVVLQDCDLVVSLQWPDLAGTLRQAFRGEAPVPVVDVSVDLHAHNGWSMDHQGLAAVDLSILCESGPAVDALLAALADFPHREPWRVRQKTEPREGRTKEPVDRPDLRDVAAILSDTAGPSAAVTFATLPRGWPVGDTPFRDPLAYLGKDGGGGVGSGLGLAIGAALALGDTGRLVVSVIGDGDYLMGVNALWTAARHRIPLLVIVANNGSYFNDELHQEAVAKARGREPANRWIGQSITDPTPDLALLAKGQGLDAFGPIETLEDLRTALVEAVRIVREGRACVVDVRIATGAERSMNEAMQDRGAAKP